MVSCGAFHSFLFEYDTPRIVLIRSRKVGLINRGVQLAILAYVIGWVFLWEKGYQETDSVVSSVTTKVKGVTLTNTSTLGARIWDVADYVIPPQEENTVFVMTNVILTLNQRQGRCPEFPDDNTECKVKDSCVPGYVSTHSSGIQTGECVPYNSSIKTCEVFAWCPVEDDYHIPKPAFLQEAENFTMLVKNNIWYPKFNFSKRNILPTINSTYLKNCIYDPQTDPFCPIFRLGKIVEAAGQNFQEMAVEGGVMALQINWDCNLDRAASHCVPKYSFRRLDNRDSAYTVSPGYNFSQPCGRVSLISLTCSHPFPISFACVSHSAGQGTAFMCQAELCCLPRCLLPALPSPGCLHSCSLLLASEEADFARVAEFFLVCPSAPLLMLTFFPSNALQAS
ncbi:P2X purinoceptor 4-like isoform X2 [Grus americana]|uniref:P2X purinoceptor 4-like isoform X2 n=1 Tax=Grus americana TaxID=9117 RepID=UPI002407C896|nr:P2X purinoceptor 4-like isoform X2 [Grus americana]